MRRGTLALLLAIVIAGCSPADTTTTDTSRYVSRYADPDYRVTCWYTGTISGGIACLPDSQVVAR